MSTPIILPQINTRVRYPVKRFSAPLLAGQYNFGIAGNADQQFLAMQEDSVYVISSLNFFAQASESDWLLSMDTEANFPKFNLRTQSSNIAGVYAEPVRCVNYRRDTEQLLFVYSEKKDENLLISFSGIVNQVPGMVGTDPLLAEVNMTIYQVFDVPWVTNYKNGYPPLYHGAK